MSYIRLKTRETILLYGNLSFLGLSSIAAIKISYLQSYGEGKLKCRAMSVNAG